MLRATLVLLSCLLVAGKVSYQENFDGGMDAWVKGTSPGDFKVVDGKYKGDKGLQTQNDASFYGIATKMDSVSNEGKDLVLSFSVTHEQNIDCGGGYIKLLPKTDPASFNGDSTYNIMFGPDICGATKKVHLIFQYKGKNLLWKKEPRCESDTLTHFYTLVLKSDNTYEMYIDMVKKESGNLEDDWDFLEPKQIDDPNDHKPSDWVDEAEMVDPDDKKPDDWDAEPEKVVDPDATKPDDWDEDEDGEWEAPMIPNPKYKGVWKPKMIPNPAYKGVWAPKKIDNPNYKPDNSLYLYKDNSAVGFDLWQVKSGTIFDNIVVADTFADAEASFTAYKGKLTAEKAAKEAAEEAERKAAEAAAEEDEEEEEEDDHDEL